METNKQNEDALRTASSSSSDNYSSILKSTKQSFNENLFNNFYSEHVVQFSTDEEIKEEDSNLDENSDENSQMLIKNENKNETIVKIDDYNLLNQFNNNDKPIEKIDSKANEEIKKSSNDKEHHHNLEPTNQIKYNHHHHYLNNRTMDLVFRNLYVSIPTSHRQDKESINKQNWFKELLINYLNKHNLIKLNSSNKLINEQKTSNKEQRLIDTHHRDILCNVSGYSRPGQLLAVMGPSGSGKTTLLNALSGRLKSRKGSITVNGEDLNKQMKRKIGYVMQNDVFFAGLTLKQTLIYTALLRMPDSISKAKKLNHVERVIELLDLIDCQDTVIGDFMIRGLSGGEKKRASIACELLTNPSIMLLDEPTSGLDSSTAFNLMQKIKEYAVKEGKTIIATIHQPSSSLFYLFDKLLLLANGSLAYFGKSTHVVPFFEGLGYTISPHYNPADLMMEKIKQKDELPKIIKAAKNLIKNYPILNHSHHRGSNASNCKHLLKLSKIESQTDWSLIGIEEDELELNNHHTNHNSNQSHSSNLINQHHHCSHHFQKHHLNTLKESIECTNYGANKTQTTTNSNELTTNSTDKELCLDMLCCKRSNCNKQLITGTRSIHDDDSGRSSWTETDRSSTSTFSSNNSCSSSTCSTEDVYSEVNFSGGHDFEIESNTKLTNRANSNLTEHQIDNQSKWPTSFLTQVNALTRRNFIETRHRMLSKLNWIQTIGLGILSGLLWFQMNRLESTLNDLRGFLFFSTSYWMLFAWFGCLISIETEREVMIKERSSGAYRLSAFYIAKMIGELPLIITLPSLYFFICYPMFQVNLNIYNFLFQWLFMILCALVAQSIGLFIGLTTMNLEVSVTVSAIYSTTINLFGGYYSSTLPNWLNWVPYSSVLHYAFQNMQIIEFYFGGPIKCAPTNSKYDYCLREIANLKAKLNETSLTSSIQLIENKNLINKQIDKLFIPYNELISTELNGNSLSFWTNIGILICFFFLFRLLGYLVLRFRMPK